MLLWAGMALGAADQVAVGVVLELQVLVAAQSVVGHRLDGPIGRVGAEDVAGRVVHKALRRERFVAGRGQGRQDAAGGVVLEVLAAAPTVLALLQLASAIVGVVALQERANSVLAQVEASSADRVRDRALQGSG